MILKMPNFDNLSNIQNSQKEYDNNNNNNNNINNNNQFAFNFGRELNNSNPYLSIE